MNNIMTEADKKDSIPLKTSGSPDHLNYNSLETCQISIVIKAKKAILSTASFSKLAEQVLEKLDYTIKYNFILLYPKAYVEFKKKKYYAPCLSCSFITLHPALLILFLSCDP